MLPKSTIKYEPFVKKAKKPRTKTAEEARASLMRLCARSEKSEGDARRLMRGWGVGKEDAEKVLAYLVKERFVDNVRYAEAFVREKTRLSGWGAYKIRTALQRKEVAKEIIDEALSEVNKEVFQTRLKERLQSKQRLVKAASAYEMRTKLMRYGLSLGFEYQEVSEAVSELLNQEELCEEFLD